ncbi:hypothetical protein MTR67_024562 [Solanum verrucosum]|uniref:Ubiquitin-like protease family profile domain-containing protein n=1 Tax=Solanum verrucosum TaxID=315347 RepID=A0AAF0TSD6_SOLVR|nr:hypothetical protein MTR67_024562 [Solanum verrucosum]
MEKTPRKSPRLNKSVVIVDSPPISSRPSGRSNEFIVINSSSSYKVQQKDDYGADTKSKGKEKLVEDHYPHDSDFEDDIPLSKRLRVNNDQYSKHVDVIMYYLCKFYKYGPDNSARVTTTDPFFISWVVQIYDAWEANGKDESLISIHHEVAQYIRGDRILANIPWVDVDHVCILVNSSDAFHWFLVVFSIRKRMIPLFLVATDYYALRKDIDWNTDVHYAGRPVGDPLVYGNRENIPQQCDNSTNVSMSGLNAENLRLRFGALLWEYGKMKIDTESVSEDEASNEGRRSNRRVKE